MLLGFVIDWLSWYMSEAKMRALLRWFPNASVKKLMEIYDTMARRSSEIIAEKKALLARGDAALAHEVGEGKDIMSICCTLTDVP